MSVGSLEILDTITPEIEDAVTAGLTAHALAQNSPHHKYKDLAVVRRNGEGKVMAALTGNTFWGWLRIELLWVDDALRWQGVGTALVRDAEDEAVRRGCHSAVVWTHSFQAPAFYAKQGYKEFVAMNDFPVGHQRLGFMKRIAA